MVRNKRFGKRVIMIAMITVGALGIVVGAANAAMQSIQLSSAASFPVDI